MVVDKTLLINCLILSVFLLGVGFWIVRKYGLDTLKFLIMKAEYIFDWKGSGKEKFAYVLNEAQKVIPVPFKWFITIKTIDRLVESLQTDFKEKKEGK